jgi:hypothetical protein
MTNWLGALIYVGAVVGVPFGGLAVMWFFMNRDAKP